MSRAGDVVTTDFGYDAWKAWIAQPEPCPNAMCDYGSRDAHFMNDWRRCLRFAAALGCIARMVDGGTPLPTHPAGPQWRHYRPTPVGRSSVSHEAVFEPMTEYEVEVLALARPPESGGAISGEQPITESDQVGPETSGSV